MAWYANDKTLTIQMAENDFGISLPVKVKDASFGVGDTLRFRFSHTVNGEPFLTKEFSDISENTVQLVFTESESELFAVGTYYYGLDWYKDGTFMCNIIPVGLLKVEDKVWK